MGVDHFGCELPSSHNGPASMGKVVAAAAEEEPQLHCPLQNGRGKEEAEAMVAAGEARDKGKVKLLTEAHRKEGKDAQLKNSTAAVEQLIKFVLDVLKYLARGTPLPTFFHRANVYSKCPQILVKDLEQPPQERAVPVGTWFLGTPAVQRKTEDGEGSWKQEQGPVGVFMVQDGETTHLLCRKTNFSYKPALTSDESSKGWCMHEIELVLPDGADKVVVRKLHRSNRAGTARTVPRGDMSSPAPAPMQALSIGIASKPRTTGPDADAAAVSRKGKAVAPAEESRLSRIAAGVGGSRGLELEADKNVLDCAPQTIDEHGLDRSIVSDSLEVPPGQVAVTTKELTPTTISQFARTQQMISAASSSGVKRKADAKVISEKKTRAPPGTRQEMSTDTDRDEVELSRHDETGFDGLENALVWARNFPVSVPQDHYHTMPVGVHDSSAGFLDKPLDVADYLELDGGWNPAHGILFDAQVEVGQQLGPEAGEMAEEAGLSAPRTIVLEQTELTSHQEISPDMYFHRPFAGDSTGEVDYSMTIEGSFVNEPFPHHQWGSGGIEGTMNYNPFQSLQFPLEYPRHGFNGIMPDAFHDGEFF